MIHLSRPSISQDECEAVCRVLKSGQLVHGSECELFEAELASYLGCETVLAVSSCTAALHLSLLALGIGHGDAVIVPDFTFPATANAVELVGATPIFVDVALDTYNIDIEKIEEAVRFYRSPQTIKAIIPVHEFGCPADMADIIRIAEKHGLYVIEDAACALGSSQNTSKVGTLGDVGCFSFHPRKALTTGEGGAVAVKSKLVADTIRLLRNHGMLYTGTGTDFILPGYNYRMTNFQAAMGRVQLDKFDGWLVERKKLQYAYREKITEKGLPVLLPSDVNGHTWQTFMVVLPDKVNRNYVIEQMKKCGIETNLGAHAVHSQPYYKRKYDLVDSDFPVSNRLYTQGLALPLSQHISMDDIERVVDALDKILRNRYIGVI